MQKEPHSAFGERVRQRLLEIGMSQVELGRGLKANGGDLGRAAVNGWVTGRGQPNVSQLAVICERLDVSADYLIFGYKADIGPRVALALEALALLNEEEQEALVLQIDEVGNPPVHISKQGVELPSSLPKDGKWKDRLRKLPRPNQRPARLPKTGTE